MARRKKKNKINGMMVFRFAFLLGGVVLCLFLLTLRGEGPEKASLHRNLRVEWGRIRLAKPPALHRSPFLPYEEPRLPQENQQALPSPLPPGTPPRGGVAHIAIVIDDMGLNATQTAHAIALPAPVTLSFLPYAPQGQAFVDQARAVGHEILLHLPMQPLSALSPGPKSLRVDMQPEILRSTLIENLDRLSGYDGVNNHMGSRLTADAVAMRTVLDVLKQKKLFFLDSRTSAHSLGAALAAERGEPWTARDVFLDDDQEGPAIRAQLDRTLRIAQEKGQAIAIGHPHPETLAVLSAWIASLPKEKAVLVPVRTLLHH